MDWCLYGDDKRKEMDRDLKPEYLLDDLRRYQAVSYTHLDVYKRQG